MGTTVRAHDLRAGAALVIAGLSLPIHSFAHVCYFTIRSGGKTVITFLFDAVYTWAVTVLLCLKLPCSTLTPRLVLRR